MINGEKVNTGDRVYDNQKQAWGTVTHVSDDQSFDVNFGSSNNHYATGGYFGQQRRIYWDDPIIIDPPKKRKWWPMFVNVVKTIYQMFTNGGEKN